MAYAVTFVDERTEEVEGATGYQQEGTLTTFFAAGAGREVIDAWSTRLASFRTADIKAIHRRDEVLARALHPAGTARVAAARALAS